MVDDNRGENTSDKEQKRKLEKDMLELLSSPSAEASSEAELLPEKKTEKEGMVPGEETAGPGRDITQKILELFPEAILVTEEKHEEPQVSRMPEDASMTPEPMMVRPEAPSVPPQEVQEVKSKQSPPAPTPDRAAPAPQKKEENLARPELPAGETAGKEIPVGKKAPLTSGGLLSRLFSPLRKSTVCLSLEGNYVRALSLQGKEVVRWATLPLNPRSVRNGAIVNPVSWGEQLQVMLDKERIKVGNLYCAFSAVSVTKEFNFPRLGSNKLREIVDREARRVLSYSSESSILRWQKLESKGQTVKVFVMLAPRDPVMKLIEALGYAGLKPGFIELKPMSLIRATGADNAIIAHGELNSLELSIVTSGEPRVLRSLYLGDVLLRKEEATSRLIDELARTLAFYNETYREEPLDISVPLFLTGELAMGSPLSTQIKALTGRVVAPLKVNLNYPPSFPLPAYLVNVGLALKDLS